MPAPSIHTPAHAMQQVLDLAKKALDQGELPIAALVELDGQVLARAATAEKQEKRYLVHAELRALEQADRLGLSFAERGRCVLYTNLEPCLMCVGAAMSFFLGQVYYGLESPSDGAVALAQDWVRREEDFPGYRLPRFHPGLLRDESLHLFERYVAQAPPGPMRDWAASLTALR